MKCKSVMARETERSCKKVGEKKGRIRKEKGGKEGKGKEKGRERKGKGKEKGKKGGKSHCAEKVKTCRVLGFERRVPKLRTRHECAERELVRAGSFKLNVVSARAENSCRVLVVGSGVRVLGTRPVYT